jgi:hypothetical protein
MRNKNGRLIDSKTKRFVKDPNTKIEADGNTTKTTKDGGKVTSKNKGQEFETKTKDGDHTLKSGKDGPEMCSKCNDLEDVYHKEMDMVDPNTGKTFRQSLDDLEGLKDSGKIDILEYGARVRKLQSKLHKINPSAEAQALPTTKKDGTPLTKSEKETEFWKDFHRRNNIYKSHEEMVDAYLTAKHGAGNVYKQVHLDVTVGGKHVRIIADNLVKVDGKFKIIDAKFSSVKQIDANNVSSTFTKNQKQAFPEISGSSGNVNVEVRSHGITGIGEAGTIIKVDPEITVLPNMHQSTAGNPIAGNIAPEVIY